MARLLSCLLLFVSAQTTLSSGVFELKIDSFTSSRGVCRSPSGDCQIFFRVCLKHAQDIINPEPPCTYGTALTEIFGADSNSISQSAPIRVPVHFKWPGAFSLIIEAWNAESSGLDSTENQNNLISRLATRRRLTVGEEWSKDVHFGNQSELHYSYHVMCNEHYHGESCSAYCRPRNDTFGHYTCNDEGKRQCQEGWSGEYCSDRKCRRSTNRDHVINPTSSPVNCSTTPPLPLLSLLFSTLLLSGREEEVLEEVVEEVVLEEVVLEEVVEEEVVESLALHFFVQRP
ncbi:Delta-like protein B [Nibea albiflora]|uniref:Delta-like protein B n=1 Tax=Nibea albiflora TaxID=240163 RepID=A0ACB7EIQ5_NIBAL|nr:Delta-like protein B [Nibea albiflora]